MDELQDRYYRHSGAVPTTSTLLMLFIGMAASAVLGLLFELLKHYLVHELIQVASSIGFGALVGLSVQLAARIAHVRNPKFAMFVGFVIGVFAVYSAWVWYLWILLKFNPLALKNAATQPEFVFTMMQWLAAFGPWKLFDFRPTGWWLYGIWITEALMIIGFAVGLSAYSSATYCEACRRWTRKVDLLLHLPLVDPDQLRADLEAENYDALYRLVGRPFNMTQRIDVTAVECPTCAASNYLTVSLVTVTGSGDQQAVRTDPIVKHLIVPRDVIETLKGRQPVEQADDPGPQTPSPKPQ